MKLYYLLQGMTFVATQVSKHAKTHTLISLEVIFKSGEIFLIILYILIYFTEKINLLLNITISGLVIYYIQLLDLITGVRITHVN